MFAVHNHTSGFYAKSENLYKPPHGRAVYGGQVIAQAMLVARKSLDRYFHCNSIHCYFLLPGNVDADITYTPNTLRTGNTFVWLEISARQKDKEIFRMMVSFAKLPHDSRFLSFQTRPQFLRSKLPRPDELISVDAYLETMRSSIDAELAKSIATYSTYPVSVEIRIPHRAFLRETAEFRREGLAIFDGDEFQVKDKPIVRRMWMKIPENSNSGEAAAMLAFLSDWPLLGTSVVPYGRTLTRKSHVRKNVHDKELLMMASLDHAMWFHGNLEDRLKGWWLFEMTCRVLRDGRATVEGHMWDESGLLLATLVQEGVVRVVNTVQAAEDASQNSQVVANLRESVTAISAQLAVIAETLQHLPAETREHELMMKTLMQLRDEHDSLKRRLQEPTLQSPSFERKFQDAWKYFFVFDAILGATLYEQQVRSSNDLRGEALWIRRVVTGTCGAVFIVLLQTLISLISKHNSTVVSVLSTSLITVRALLLASALLNDLMRLPKALHNASTPPPPPPAEASRGSFTDKVRERTSRKLEISTSAAATPLRR